MKHIHLFAFAVIAVVLLTGCPSKKFIATEPVEGIVTLDGEPLEGCSITLFPVEEGQGEPGYSYTDAKGFYRVGTLKGKIDAGTTPGEYIVGFSKYTQVPTGRKVKDENGDMVDQTKEANLLHSNYESREKSPWRITVTKGKNQFDFPLNAKGTGPSE